MCKRYGISHSEKNDFSKELLQYGKIKADSETQDINGNYIRIRCVRYKDEVWFHHMENGEVLEIFSM